MKKRMKRWLIAAAVLVILGLGLFAGAMAVQHWDFRVLNLEW